MAFLTPDKTRTEHGLVIKEKIIPWGATWNKNYGSFKKGDLYKADRKLSGGTGKVQYITIHNTADIAEAAGTNDAEQYTRATYPNQNMGDARVHYFIDETDCWQNLREDEVGWHAGDGRGNGNETSLGIEIIMDGSGSKDDKSAEDRGALLAAILLNRHGLSIDRMVSHKHWSGKNCPMYILPHWETFKATVANYLKKIKEPATTESKGVSVAVDAINSTRSTNYLVMYFGKASTGTNKWGAEVAFDAKGKALADPVSGVGNMAIPSGGFVLSGHGSSSKWILANIKKGTKVRLSVKV